MKFFAGFFFGVRRCRGFDQREGRIRELLPDREILRRNREPSECEHVSARFGHTSGLLPRDFIDDQSFCPLWSPSLEPKSGAQVWRPSLGPKSGIRRQNKHFTPHAGLEQSSTRSQFEGVELQGERRQRQPQIVQFFGPRNILVILGCPRMSAGDSHRWCAGEPAGWNRRGHPHAHLNQPRPASRGSFPLRVGRAP
jgi:hypothetical protein